MGKRADGWMGDDSHATAIDGLCRNRRHARGTALTPSLIHSLSLFRAHTNLFFFSISAGTVFMTMQTTSRGVMAVARIFVTVKIRLEIHCKKNHLGRHFRPK